MDNVTMRGTETKEGKIRLEWADQVLVLEPITAHKLGSWMIDQARFVCSKPPDDESHDKTFVQTI